MPYFESVPLLPDDPIFSLTDNFKADPREQKVNLGVGTYKDAEGQSTVMSAVKKAEALLLQRYSDKEYLPIGGDAQYLEESLKLVFGQNSEPLNNGKIVAVQTLGGTGALRIAGEFLTQEKHNRVFVPTPTWPNHKPIFIRAALQIHEYPYFNAEKYNIDFVNICHSIKKMEPGDAIVLHACCHNPTGMDFSIEQWKELSSLIKTQKVIPFIDMAYLGFSKGIEQDAFPVRYFAEQGHEMFVAHSYSKSFGLYNDRIGVLFMVANTHEGALKIASQLRSLIRGNYSNAPAHGSRIVTTILQSEELRKEWHTELENMVKRIKEMRGILARKLQANNKGKDYSFLNNQNGLFSYGIIDPSQVQTLKDKFGIYVPINGRLNVAGLNPKNIDYVSNTLLSII